jgi:hypothetical protein
VRALPPTRGMPGCRLQGPGSQPPRALPHP